MRNILALSSFFTLKKEAVYFFRISVPPDHIPWYMVQKTAMKMCHENLKYCLPYISLVLRVKSHYKCQ